MADLSPEERTECGSSCVVCGNPDTAGASPASGIGENKAWICGPCLKERERYLNESHGTVLDGLAWAARRAREACAKIADGWAAYYPTDVFPEDSESLDAKSADHGRRVARGIAHDIRSRGKETPRG